MVRLEEFINEIESSSSVALSNEVEPDVLFSWKPWQLSWEDRTESE